MNDLAEEKQRAIKALREYGFSQNKTQEAVGIGKSTVRKYSADKSGGEYDEDLDPNAENACMALPGELDPRDVLEPEYVHEDFIPEGDGEMTDGSLEESPFEDENTKDLRVAEDYTTLTPGQFIEQFFEGFEVGVRGNFVEMQARRAQRRNELPDEEKMRSDLKEMSSGISNAQEAHYIAEEYWAEAERFVADNGTDVFRGARDTGGGAGSHGDFVSVGHTQQGQPGQQQGQWVQMPDGSQQYGTFVQGQNGQMQFQPMHPPGQPAQAPGLAPTQQDSEVESLKEDIRDLKRAVTSEQSASSSAQEMLQEVAEVQETIEQLQGDEGQSQQDEMVRALRGELQQLRAELSDDTDSLQADNPKEAAFKRLMTDEAVDTETLLDFADRMDGASDPEVEMKRIEHEMERKRMDMKRERTEKVMTAFEDVADRFGSALGRALAQGGDGDDAGADGGGGGGGAPSDGGGSPHGFAAEGGPTMNGSPPPQGSGGQPGINDFTPDDFTPNEYSSGDDPDVEIEEPEEPVTDGAGPTFEAGQSISQPSVEGWECSECGAVTPQSPTSPGKSCGQCDFSVVPCPECQRPIAIPPESEVDRGGCPECGRPVMIPDDIEETTACLGCDWTGPASDAAGETVECDNCGEEHAIQPEAR